MATKILIPVALACMLAAPAQADDTGEDKSCIPIVQISNTRILSNRAILFEMRPGPDYITTLPRACPGLNRNSAIMYATSLNVLCDLDMITVLNSAGGGYMRGATCGLGKFVPTEEGADTLREYY